MGAGSGGDIRQSGEKAVLPFVKSRSGAPYVIFDVGANQGQFLTLILQNFKNDIDFSVHCFEPSRFTFDILKSHFQKLSHIKLNNFALGKEKGQLKLYYPFDGTGYASLTQRNMKHYGLNFEKSEEISIETMDSYCEKTGIKHVNLLKIDVEGHELGVLLGAQGMFESRRIDFCTFEFGGACIDTKSSFKDFYYFFTDNEMQIYRITPSGYLHEIDSYSEIDEIYRDTNFLAARKELLK